MQPALCFLKGSEAWVSEQKPKQRRRWRVGGYVKKNGRKALMDYAFSLCFVLVVVQGCQNSEQPRQTPMAGRPLAEVLMEVNTLKQFDILELDNGHCNYEYWMVRHDVDPTVDGVWISTYHSTDLYPALSRRLALKVVEIYRFGGASWPNGAMMYLDPQSFARWNPNAPRSCY